MTDSKLTKEQQALADRCTHLQRMLIINLVAGADTLSAYRAAGGKAKNDKSALNSAKIILENVAAKAFYDSLVAEAATAAILTREQALERLTEIALCRASDVAEFSRVQVGEDKEGNPIYQSVWRLKNDDEIEKSHVGAISELGTSASGLKFKMHSPLAAIKQIAEMQGWEAPKKLEVDDKRPPLMKREAILPRADDQDVEPARTH